MNFYLIYFLILNDNEFLPNLLDNFAIIYKIVLYKADNLFQLNQ